MRVAILGHLIHNRVYNESLEVKGVVHLSVGEIEAFAAQSAADGVPCVAVIRTHGIPRAEEEHLAALAARYPLFSVLDMTCPFVKKIHRIADDNTGERTVFFLLGTRSHPEVEGIVSHVRGECFVFSTAEELKNLLPQVDIGEKIGRICS